MSYLNEINIDQPEVVELFDKLPLWSAPFGLLLLDRVPLKPGIVILDVGAGTGFLTVELAQRCGPAAKVIAVDPWTAAMDPWVEVCRGARCSPQNLRSPRA